MQYRSIAGTDLAPSLLGFGNFVFGTNWWGDFTDAEAVRLQNVAVDAGVTFFDTAPAYGNGRAESLLRQTIDYAGRDRLVISTKFGYDFYSDPGEEGSHRERRQDFSPSFVRADLERSLERLGIDCIDLYQAHNLKLPHFADDLFGVLEKLVVEGKIRAWGAALGPAIGWREEGREALLSRGAATVQTVFNLYEQDPGREFCQAASLRSEQAEPGRASPAPGSAAAIIARVPTNSGILDDEFESPDHVFEPHDHRKFRDRNWLVSGLAKNQIVRPLAREFGLTLGQFALRWLASQPEVLSVEPNLLSESDVIDAAAACDGSVLPDRVLGDLEALYEKDFDLGPEAHPCDLKSSVAPDGHVRSGFEAVAT